jgi:tetratricopeptide (TPR) repeat protein/tRNA A-37 threonylcarbamoyl transferase component Bud32
MVKCPACGKENAPHRDRCVHCGGALAGTTGVRVVVSSDEEEHTELGGGFDEDEHTEIPGQYIAGEQTKVLSEEPDDDATAHFDTDSLNSGAGGGIAAPPRAPGQNAGPLEIGASFGARYRIDQLLGFGGMGAVYKAWDNELDIPVALKVIRPEVARDPALAQQLDRRFKRELLLARQVTHKNVVRIHDLGEIDGIKYITMTFIEGEDLLHILKRDQTVSVAEALKILRPVVSGLAAAHAAGVVHRDLKPANVMVEPSTGESYIMDFGIARSATPTGADVAESLVDAKTKKRMGVTEETQAGAVVGTLQYMAPEQFSGKGIDHRADIYSFGLIFYDLLVGRRRVERTESAFSEFRSRVATAPPATRTIDPSIPEPVDRIITRCLQPDPDERYATTAELEADLNRLDDEGHLLPVMRRLTRKMVVGVAALVTVLLAGTWWLATLRGPTEAPEPFSVLVADFDNRTGDPLFDGALEQTLTIAMEGAAFISAIPPANAHQIAEQIQPGSRVDETMARLISRREGISVILVGEIQQDGSRYLLSVRALDPGLEPGEGKPLAVVRATAADKDEVLAAVGKIASELRGELGDTTPKADRLAAAETFTAASVEAMEAYARGQDLAVQGKFEAALAAYREAVAADPAFGRAYAGMGVTYGNLRRETEAEEAYQKAFQHLDRMSERERYRTLGGYYLLVSHNYEKAIENYRTLVEQFPADGGAYSNLGYAYHMVRQFDKAVEAGRRSVELDPGNLIKRINYAIYATYAGDFETAMAESEKVYEQNPDFGYALFTLGRAAAASGDIKKAQDVYSRLAESGGMGSSLAPMGAADMLLTVGRYRDAVDILEPAIEVSDNPFEKATMLVALGEARLALGKREAAIVAADRALDLSENDGVRYLGARLLMAADRGEEADEIALELENRLQSQTTALSALIRGERALDKGQLGTAMREFRFAREDYDFWFGHFLRGRAFFAAEHFPEALDEFDHCVRGKGEITDVFLVDSATLRYYPPALYWLGRCHEALGNKSAADDLYRQFVALRGDADPADPLATDATQRLNEER